MTSGASRRGGMSEAWAIPEFRRLMYSRLVSNVGNGITPVALSFGVLGLKGANGTSLSIVNGSLMLSMALCMLAGGVIADRFGRCRVVGTSDVLGAVVVGTSATLFILGNASVPFLAFNAFVLGALNAVWLPAYRGIIPQIVPQHVLQQANSINGVFANIFFVAGSALAGVIVGMFGAGWAIMVDAVSFLIAGALVLSLRRFDTVREGNRTSPMTQLREGWRGFLQRQWMVGTAIGTAAYFFAFEAFISVVGPVQAKNEFGGARAWGLVLAGWGVGGFVGVVAAARIHPRRPLLAGWSVMSLNALWMLSIAAALPLVLVVVGAVVAGAAGDFNFILGVTVTQTHVPEDVLSRVNSFNELSIALFTPLGLVLAGPLVDARGASFAAVGTAALVIVAVSIPLLFRSVRSLERIA